MIPGAAPARNCSGLQRSQKRAGPARELDWPGWPRDSLPPTSDVPPCEQRRAAGDIERGHTDARGDARSETIGPRVAHQVIVVIRVQVLERLNPGDARAQVDNPEREERG